MGVEDGNGNGNGNDSHTTHNTTKHRNQKRRPTTMKSSLILLCGISATAHASVANIFDTVNSIQHRELKSHMGSNSTGSSSKCPTEIGKEALEVDCLCGMSTETCAKGKYCWSQFACKDTAYPCGEKEKFCGRYGIKGWEAMDKMYKEDFKGGCADPTTCPTAPADDKSTPCQIQIAMNSEPGKCMAVCSVGYAKEYQETLTTLSKCTDDEKKQWDEANEKNQAALSSGSTKVPYCSYTKVPHCGFGYANRQINR